MDGARQMTMPTHPCWLSEHVAAALGRRRIAVPESDDVAAKTLSAEARALTARHGGALVAEDADVVLAYGEVPDDGFAITRDSAILVEAANASALLRAWFHLLRLSETCPAWDAPAPRTVHSPTQPIRMLDHWDNVVRHEVMGQVERGYAGDSLFYVDGRVRDDLSHLAGYGRLLASVGINRVALNNVNVHAREARLLTEGRNEVARLAAAFRPWGIRSYLSVSFAAPMTVGGLPTADPLNEDVRRWWADAAAALYDAVPDLGGFVVKADSEGQPGPFGWGRTHAEGANVLARALAPHGGEVFWRTFVYNHRQDWRDRSTDRARAAYDHFTPLDGQFDDNVVLQVKHGPMDFQPREPVSPLLAAMPATNLAIELQVTQEYTGQQKHVCYLGPWWSEILRTRLGEHTVGDLAAGTATGRPRGGAAGVSNVGTDTYWTGHPLAQANLYAFGRLSWDHTLDALAVLDEWIRLTFGDDPEVHAAVADVMVDSWRTYEHYTAPLGVGFMVRPHHHYGPDVDGYEYTPWGTYHFADRDGVGVNRSVATGTGYASLYPAPQACAYESAATCPDELLLFFHHVPYGHVLASGITVIQHIYDTHFAGVEEVVAMRARWQEITGRVSADVHARVSDLLEEQLRSAIEWRDQLTTYFFRKSGVPDARGRTIYP